MDKVFLNFHPRLGDLALMRAVATELKRKYSEHSFALTNLQDEGLADFYKTSWFEVIQTDNSLTDFTTKPINHPFVKFKKKLCGKGELFHHIYTEINPIYVMELERVIEANLDLFKGITKIYTLHYQFEVAYIGYYLARKYSIQNEGFTLRKINDNFYLKQPIWHPSGIMAMLNQMLDINMSTSHLRFGRTSEAKAKTVLLLPTSRSQILLANQYWELTKTFFALKGFKVTLAEHGKNYHSFDELTKLINEHALIVCNDSFPYHVACGLEKKIILLEKAGFNSEWKHAPYTENNVYSIPSSPMYVEEFLSHLIAGLKQLEVK